MLSRLRGVLQPILVALLTGIVVAALSLLMPNYYRAEARVLPSDSRSAPGGVGAMTAAAAAFGVSIPGSDGGGDANFLDILNSRWLGERLLQTRYQFHEKTWRFGKETYHAESLQEYLGVGANTDKGIGFLRRCLGNSRDIKSRVITLTAEMKSPELAQQVVNREIELLEEFLRQKGRTKGGAKAIFAEERLNEANAELAKAEEATRTFLDGNRNYASSVDPGVRLKGSHLEMELKLRQQLVMTLAMSREQALLEERNDIPVVNVMDGANLPIDKSRPSRASLVMNVMAMAFLSVWAWKNRAPLKKFFIEHLEP